MLTDCILGIFYVRLKVINSFLLDNLEVLGLGVNRKFLQQRLVRFTSLDRLHFASTMTPLFELDSLDVQCGTDTKQIRGHQLLASKTICRPI